MGNGNLAVIGDPIIIRNILRKANIIKDFTTNSGIKLGDKQEQILKKLGKPNDLQEENATSIVTYITEQNESKLLQEFDMPLYYEKFIFSNGVLKEYEFGFEYP